MSVRIMALVWDTPLDNHTKKLVALAIADNANDAGVCWPSIPTIARKCDLSAQGVLNKVKALEKDGWLTIKRSHGRSNTYTVHPPTPLTPQQALPPNAVEANPPTAVTPPPNAVDLNHKEPSVEPPTSDRGQRHQQFIAEWCAAYENEFGQRYRVTPRDGKAVKELLTEGEDAEALVWTAQQAWRKGPKAWNCHRSITIHFFAAHLNEVRAELRGPGNKPPVAPARERKF